MFHFQEQIIYMVTNAWLEKSNHFFFCINTTYLICFGGGFVLSALL